MVIENPVPGYFSERDKGNYQRFALYVIVATLLFITATVLLAERIIQPGPVAWVLVGATVVAALLTVHAYIVFLRGADELLQKIHREALALGFGAGVAFMPCWRLFERLGAIKLDVNDGMFVMMLFFILGLNRGYKRYAGGTE